MIDHKGQSDYRGIWKEGNFEEEIDQEGEGPKATGLRAVEEKVDKIGSYQFDGTDEPSDKSSGERDIKEVIVEEEHEDHSKEDKKKKKKKSKESKNHSFEDKEKEKEESSEVVVSDNLGKTKRIGS